MGTTPSFNRPLKIDLQRIWHLEANFFTSQINKRFYIHFSLISFVKKIFQQHVESLAIWKDDMDEIPNESQYNYDSTRHPRRLGINYLYGFTCTSCIYNDYLMITFSQDYLTIENIALIIKGLLMNNICKDTIFQILHRVVFGSPFLQDISILKGTKDKFLEERQLHASRLRNFIYDF